MKYYFLLFLLFFFVSCGESKVERSEKTYYPLEMCSQYDEKSDIADIEIIEMKHSFNNIAKILLTDKYMIISDNRSVMCFTKDGKFVGKYGDKGNANSEYNSIVDIAISFDSKTLYIYDFNRILFYNVEDKTHIKTLQLTSSENDSNGFYLGLCPGADSSFYFFMTYGATEVDGEKALPYLCKHDSKGDKVSEHLFWENIVFGYSPIRPTYNNRYFIKPQGEDKICYEICKDSLLPQKAFIIDFGDKLIPFRYGLSKVDNSEDLRIQIDNYFDSDYFKSPSSVLDNEKYIILATSGPKNILYQFIIDKKNDKGIYYKSSRIRFLTSDKDHFYAELPVTFGENGFDKMIQSKISKLSLSDENTYLLKCKFKL